MFIQRLYMQILRGVQNLPVLQGSDVKRVMMIFTEKCRGCFYWLIANWGDRSSFIAP